MSFSLAARISLLRASIASAMACSAALRWAPVATVNVRPAPLALSANVFGLRPWLCQLMCLSMSARSF